jgi:hypothetical protein
MAEAEDVVQFPLRDFKESLGLATGLVLEARRARDRICKRN